MASVSEFIFNLVNPNFHKLKSQTGDLMIVETGLTSLPNGNVVESWVHTNDDASTETRGIFLSADQIGALQAQGRTVIGYLNVAISDHERGYWVDSWVDYQDPKDGGGPGNRDVGPVNPGAPGWLQRSHGVATDGGNTVFGPIVDYSDPAWQARVIAEAVHMVTPKAQGGLGYSGLFLDDVSRYYDAAVNDSGCTNGCDGCADCEAAMNDLAATMIRFVNAISDAVHAVKSDAYIAINGGAFIGWDSALPSGGRALKDFFTNVDALLLENQYGDAWGHVLTNGTHWGGGQDFLAIEHSGHSTPATFANWARNHGVTPLVVADDDYDDVPAITPPAGSGRADRIFGGNGPNRLDGGTGADRLSGFGGNDTLIGGVGADTLWAGAGQDVVRGGLGRDTSYLGAGDDRYWDTAQSGRFGADKVFGGAGKDTVFGGGGNDTIGGGGGNDVLRGGAGNDILRGGSGQDRMFGGDGRDTIQFRAGDDTGTGGKGADRFIFKTGSIGQDTIRDFTKGVDQLLLDDQLWQAQLTPQQVVNQFASVTGGEVVFAFGDGNSVTLSGVTSTAGLAADIDIV